MPPNVPRKRLREDSPERSDHRPTAKKGKSAVAAPPRKPTLFDALDATASPKTTRKTRQQLVESSDDSSSSLTSLSDADFEDVPGVKEPATVPVADDDEDDDVEFEDVAYPTTLAPKEATGLKDGALELTLSHIPSASYTDFGGKRGPSKSERRIRAGTHCMHVQFLMWHNAMRNAWLCDPLVQGIMMSHLPAGIWDEIERFRRNSGLGAQQNTSQASAKDGAKSKTKAKGKGKQATKPAKDWSGAAERLEKGAVDMSFGDPLFRLLKSLSAWWRKRFRVTAPGLRKIGYMETRRSTNLIKGYRDGGTNPRRYGERISNLEWFRWRAQTCTGSRDVGSQLFTALLRAIGLEARMVANLQPCGFGFTKFEEAHEEGRDEKADLTMSATINGSSKASRPDVSRGQTSPSKSTNAAKHSRPRNRESRQNSRRSFKESTDDSADDDLELSDDSDDASVVELPPLNLSKQHHMSKLDKDLEFPNYWTEVLSPATQRYVPVDALVKNIVGTNRELIESLEPRGAKADKSKQVMAYVIGFSDDGTAKDVTVRYLKNRTLPGRTKGTRTPIEKIPVYNKNGKVKRYEQYDWFKTVMSGYSRGGEDHPLTDIDYDEDFTDLKPAQPQKKEVKEGEETLQYYKQSKEFVLSRHLKREEALLPDAKPVKWFKIKGKKGEASEEEPVYARKNVVQVKSEETWHKQGRIPKPGAIPLKHAPYRAATTNRRRELAEAEALSGHKVMQPLYSYDQTDWIIPPPIENGVIPKNQYGNIDLFVEHMLPQGAAHVPYRGAVRVCRRLEIDFAEAVVDFEFGHRMAVPVIQGVVVAEEHFDKVMEELAKDEAEKKRKEDEKRRKVVLATWRRLLMGMRIRERVRKEYGEVGDSYEVFGHSRYQPDRPFGGEPVAGQSEDMAGGFLPEGYDEEDGQEEEDGSALRKSSFFLPVVDDDEDGASEGDGGLVVEDDRTASNGPGGSAFLTPISGDTSFQDAEEGSSERRTRVAPRKRSTRTAAMPPPSDVDDEEGDDMEDDEDMDDDDDYEG